MEGARGVEPSQDETVRAWSRYPGLMRAAQTGVVSFDHLVKSYAIAHRWPDDSAMALLLQQQIGEHFGRQFGAVHGRYFCSRLVGGVVLCERKWRIYSAVNLDDPEIVEVDVECRRLSLTADQYFTGGPAKLKECQSLVFSALSRMLRWADLTVEPGAEASTLRNAAVATRSELALARERVGELVQRQARLQYFYGALLGTPVVIGLVAVLGVLAARWDRVVSPSSLVASTVFGALGAVISVVQRMASGKLVLDYAVPRQVRVLLGGLRPLVGSVLAAVAQFALIAGLVTGQADNRPPAASFAFYALVGFAAGFSERFASDLVEHATGGLGRSRDSSSTTESTDTPSPRVDQRQ